MDFKRITMLCGHYGSGKTNIAVNLALEIAKTRSNVVAADLDIVNPYFRTKDSINELNAASVRMIVSEYANTNVDIPALPQEMYSVTDDRSITAVLDIGGDDRGALALGRLAPAILEENNYDMLLVINCYRPLTSTVGQTIEVAKEIEGACKIRFTGIVNNSNLGSITSAEDVLSSLDYARQVSEKTGLPIVLTTVKKELYNPLCKKVEKLFPISLQKSPLN